MFIECFRKTYIEQAVGGEWDLKDLIGGIGASCYPIDNEHVIEEKFLRATRGNINHSFYTQHAVTF